MRSGIILLGIFLLAAFGATAEPAGEPTPAGAAPQTIQGVFPDFNNWEAYAGYSYVRLYELPALTVNRNGFNAGATYYPKAGWIGIDGEFVGVFGSQASQTSVLLLEVAGVKARWTTSRGVELWIHGLAGGAHLTPQTGYGSESAFGYELGGGIDITPRRKRLGFRLAADMVGTRFFGTGQYSPKVSAGIVYKF